MIAVRSLRKSRAGKDALRGIDLEVAPGSVAAVIGSSGSGKTTLLRCINGLESFDDGVIDAFGTTLRPGRAAGHDELARLRRSVGMVFQGFHLFPHMHVLDNLTLAPRAVLGERRDEAETRGRALLERMGLSGREKSMPHTLSGGQQQRVAIARAMMMRPKALLLDEPTSALDPRHALDVLAVLLELARDGQTMIVATHALSFARKAAARVHVLADGEQIECGSPDEVFDNPRHEATRTILDAARG
ncbi:MAG: amino acid ABC transporter ATP-binding protein [Polyangiaceae bacterium]|nr:amino acid ABC transporter ATP-binding protein [Polyangiaceae bacterium]